ncbi:MAG: [LysW]-aminoadipate kinase [Thermomicrobiales bacterium]
MTILIKLGGSAGIDNSLTVDDLAAMWPEQRIVMVHGANAELDAYIRSQGREPAHVTSSRGQVSRYTDEQTMSDMMAIYAGQTNKRIVELFQQRGVNAVGISAMDGGTARGRRKDTIRVVEDGKKKVLRGDHAGSIEEIDTTLIELLLDNGYLPVLTPPAVSTEGVAINVDGDKLALELATALGAEALVFLSNTAGLLRDVDDPDSLIGHINTNDDDDVARALEAAGGRMQKKVEAGVGAVRSGIGTVVFADARVERPVSGALAGNGTVLTAGVLQEV